MPPLKDYLSPNADSLADKVALTKIIGDFGRAGVAALFAAVSGFILSANRAAVKLVSTIANSAQRVVFALLSSITKTSKAATDTAAKSLSGAEIFALPTGTLIALASLVAIAGTFYVFWGEFL